MRPAIERQHGVTLVEMIVVIAISGILVAMVGLFGRRQIDAYLEVSSRAALADAADTALRRIGRDLQGALPNSVRVSGGTLLEFVPIRDAGRYRADFRPDGTGNPLDFASADTSFEVLGPTVSAQANDRLVIYNLGIAGSDIYEGSSSRALTTTGSGLSTLAFAGASFPFESPQHRFHIAGGPVTYECAPPNLLRHWCYAFSAAQPTAFGALAAHPGCAAEQTAVLVDNLDVGGCSITYTPGALARNGLVSISLRLTANGESMTLMHQVEVLNSP